MAQDTSQEHGAAAPKRIFSDAELGFGASGTGAQPTSAPKVYTDAELGFAPQAPSLGRSVGDSAIALGTGVAQGVKMVSDAFGANNAVSRLMGKGIQAAEGLESDYRKAEKQERARKIKAAEDSGSTWEEVKAYAGSMVDAPLDTTLNAVGSVVPTLAAAALTGGGSAAAQLAARVAPVAIGAVQGAGAVKGGIYDAVEQRHLEAGATPEQAAERAKVAQGYTGDNLGSIAAGAGLGMLAGSTGAEAAVRRLARVGAAKQAADASALGIVKGAAAGAAKEAPMEAVQGGQERLAANLAEQGEGFDTPTMRGVLGQAALEGMAAAPLGGGLGAVEASGRAGRVDLAAARHNAEAAAQDAQAKTDAQLADDAMVAEAQLQAQQRAQELAEQEAGAPEVPQTPPPDGAAALRAQQEAAAAARQQALETSRAVQEPDDEILQSTGQAEPVRPSEAMGLRADAGGLESVAAMAVDAGLTEQLQAQTAAQQPEAQQKQEQSAQDQQGINAETGEVSDATREQQIRERLDFLGQQGRAQGWSPEAVAQRDALQQELDLLSPGQRIEQLNAQADAAAAEAADWAGRQYKPNPQELPEHAAQGGPADVGEANEQRRLKKVVQAKGEEASARAQADALQAQGNAAAQLAAKHDLAALRRKKTDEMSTEELQALAADLGPRHVRAKRLQQAIAEREAQAQPAINQGVNDRGPQTDQTQQASPQQPQAGAAPGLAIDSGAPAAGAQAAKLIAQEGNQRREAEQQRKLEASERWTRMTTVERQAVAEQAQGLNAVAKKNLHSRAWADISEKNRKALLDVVVPQAEAPSDMQAFAPETGTLGIPRADMPQVPTQSHGGLVKHLNAQGIAHETTTVDAATLKPTQAEYSPSKVAQAKQATGGRAVIVSNDGHIIDGHHQAMAAAEDGKPVKAIVLDAPVEQALEAVKASPSVQKQDAPPARESNQAQSAPAGRPPAASFRRSDTGTPQEFDVPGFLKAMNQGRADVTEHARAQAVQRVQATADAIRKAWANGPEVVVAYDMADPAIPAAVRQADLQQRSGGASGDPEGFYHQGKAYLLASQLQTPNDAARVLFHESLGHHGLRGAFGKALDGILDEVATVRQADVDAKIQEYGLRGGKALDRRIAAEEVLAEMAQSQPQIGFVKRAVAAIRAWLRAHVPGFNNLKVSDAELIRNYILPARAWVERGGLPALAQSDVGFSRSAMKSVNANVSRGREALSKALNDKTTVHRAMFRNGLGWVDFVWGSEGAVKPNGRTKGGMGLVHILEARQRKDGLTEQESVSFLSDVVDAIALGSEFDRKEVAQSTRVGVEHDKTIVWLTKNKGTNAWIVTGYEKVPSDAVAGRATTAPTLGAASRTRDSKEGTETIVKDSGDLGNIMFSRSKLADLKTKGLELAHNAMTHPGKVSLWDKTVGTMRHIAQRYPAFKPVFESAQQFIDDVSSVANEAAQMAPRLIPRVESLGDLAKKPISVADNQAIGKALFAGTLDWGRDQHGKAMPMEALRAKYRGLTTEQKAEVLLAAKKIEPQMLAALRGKKLEQFDTLINNKFESTMLKAGAAFNHKELKEFFGLNEQQISLYDEARATVDKSLDITARAEMLRTLGRDWDGMREIVMDAPTLTEAWQLLDDELEQRAKQHPDTRDRQATLMQQLSTTVAKAKELMDHGYMPLQRFGKYTVDVVDAAGERVYFGMFESKAESHRMARAMEREYPGAVVTQGTINDQQFKLFAGITPETAELFGAMLGLDAEGNQAKDQAFQEYLKLAKNNHSAMKRLIHRKGIAGYSEDVGRVLASFVYSNARAAATGLNAGKMEAAIHTLNTEHKDQGELGEIAAKLRSYIQDPQEEGQVIRGMLFAQYLGGSIASAMVNMTQPFAVTMPWLSQYGGMAKAGRFMAGALQDMSKSAMDKGFRYAPDLAHALKMAEDDGVVSPQEIHQLMAQARGAGGLRSGDGTRTGDARAKASNLWEKGKVAWGQPFALAEQFNRRSTFIAAYRLAKDQGMDNPAQFARDAVVETQFLYTKANKPQWARGAIGGTLFTFKTYSVSFLELMQRTWNAGEQGSPERAAGRRAVGWAMLMLMLMGGAGGLPFVEDVEDLVDGAGQMMGYNLSSKQWRQEFMAEWLGQELAGFLEQGLSGLPGAPIDVSGRLGMGNLIPGTGLALSKQSNARDLVEMVGPAGDLIQRGFSGAGDVLKGIATLDAASVGRGALEVMPNAVRNAVKGADMAASGIYKDTKGYKVIDTTLDEAVFKMIGFQPRSVAEVQEANSFMQRSKSFYTQTSNEIRAQWAKALFEKDDAAVASARARLERWNSLNPDQPIRINMPDVWKRAREMGKDRTQRIAETAPTAIRQQMRAVALEQGR